MHGDVYITLYNPIAIFYNVKKKITRGDVGDSLEHVADAAHALDLLLAEVAHAGRVAHTLVAHARTRIIRVCVCLHISSTR